jgi:hypothetical protein
MAKHRTHSIEFKREVVQEFPTPSPSAIPKGDTVEQALADKINAMNGRKKPRWKLDQQTRY